MDLFIILRLGMPEFIISAVLLGQQLTMAAGLYHLPPVKHRYHVAETAGGQAVADVD